MAATVCWCSLFHLFLIVNSVFSPADDTTLIGLISGGDESTYRWGIEHLVTWCGLNNLELNALKTVDMVVDFRKNPAPPAPITIVWLPIQHCGDLLLPGNHHHPGPQVGAEHQLPHQESSAEYLLPAAAEEVQPARVSDGSLLHHHQWVHPLLLHHHLVHCCHCQGQGQTTAYHSLCQEGDWLQSAIPPELVHLKDPEKNR